MGGLKGGEARGSGAIAPQALPDRGKSGKGAMGEEKLGEQLPPAHH